MKHPLFSSLIALTVFTGTGFADEIPTGHLVLDLDAARGVERDASGGVRSWRNQAADFPAQTFLPNDRGRKVAGSGIPKFRSSTGERMFPSIEFRQQELINSDEDAFDHLTKGSGHTWYVVVSPYEQTSERKNTHAIFGNLRNTAAADGGTGGQFEGFWGVFHDNRQVYAGVRNGKEFTRNSGNNPEVLSKTVLEKGRFYVVAGRMAAGTNRAKVEVFVNSPIAENAAEVLVRQDANPSRMAVGQERDATNHPGAESFDGEIARLLIYDATHSDAEVEEVLKRLREKYRIDPGK